MKFETKKSYGNDCTIEVLKRTEKTLTIKSVFGTQRIKVKTQPDGTEYISFKCWLIEANEFFDQEEATNIFLSNAYYK